MALKILIVDDSFLARAAHKRIIEMVDLDVGNVYEAGSGAEALQILAANEVDIVLTDLNMPEMTGVELVGRMKEDSSLADIPVVVVSTESSTTRIQDLLSEGIKDFLHKPFTPEEFRSVIMRNVEACHDRV